MKCSDETVEMSEKERISNKIKNDYLNGAIVVSSSEYFCNSFIRAYDLNPKLFKTATRFEEFREIEPDTPIILTYYQNRNGFSELRDMIDVRFKNVKYIDY